MADYVLDCMNDDESLFEYGGENLRTCKYCGTGGLRWGQHSAGRWILVANDGHRHVCGQTATAAKEEG